jgi:transcriptional regulator GlxA family with amidase domain
MTVRFSGIVVMLVSFAQFQCNNPGSVTTDIGPAVLPGRELHAAILVVNGVFNTELMAPMDVFQHTAFHSEKGIRVFTVSQNLSPVTTFEGLKIIPDYSFTSDSLPGIDILVVPSAKNSMDSDLSNIALLDFVKQKAREASYVVSLCDGAFVLAKAGLLDLHECTTFPGDVSRFRETFPMLKVHESVSFVHDRKMITSAGGARSYEPALYLVELLYGKEAAVDVAKGLVIDWNLASVPKVLTKR